MLAPKEYDLYPVSTRNKKKIDEMYFCFNKVQTKINLKVLGFFFCKF